MTTWTARLACRAALLTVAAASSAAHAAPRAQVDAACVAWGTGPMLECTVRVAREALPLDGLQVTLGASMPSMPMAHSVRPVKAVATGRPGEYRGTLELEMNGAWALQIDLAGALRDRVVRTFDVDECEGDRRCPVAAAKAGAAPRAGAPAHKH